MAKIVGICTRAAERADMVVYASAKVSFEHGVGDDYRGLTKGDRQVTVMTKEGWDAACDTLGVKMHWTTRRANLLVEGLNLENSTGDILKIGNFFLEITGELAPCGRMDEEFSGLQNALAPNWRGGICCKILREGVVYENDEITVMERG